MLLPPPPHPTPPPSPGNGRVLRRGPALRYNVTKLKLKPILGVVTVFLASVAFGVIAGSVEWQGVEVGRLIPIFPRVVTTWREGVRLR